MERVDYRSEVILPEQQLSSPSAERAVIGAILINQNCKQDMNLTGEAFHDIRHATIWNCIEDMEKAGVPIDFVTLCNCLDDRKELNIIGGPGYITSLENECPTSLYGAHYADIVYEKWTRRKLLRVANELANKALDEDHPIVDYLIENPFKALDFQPKTVKSFADMAQMIGPIEWLWPGWLPAGMLTILVGEGGSGKSSLALKICTSVLLGKPWPDKNHYKNAVGSVLWCEAEAAQAINLSRAAGWGLPMDNILLPLPNPLEDLKLDDDNHKALFYNKAHLDEVKLIVIDSLRGILGRGDENSSDTLSLIKFIAETARDSGKPIILIHHLRKSGLMDNGEITLDRVRGSSAIVQTARMVWALDTPDQTQKFNRRLSVIKSNLARFPEEIGMIIDENGVNFGAAPEKPHEETVTGRAADLLLALLQKGPMSSIDLQAEFNAAGISKTTLDRAKARLGVVSIKNRGDGRWFWSLPYKSEELFDNDLYINDDHD
jgi:putative DNA primase/helicase